MSHAKPRRILRAFDARPLYLLAKLNEEGALGLNDPWHLMGAQGEDE